MCEEPRTCTSSRRAREPVRTCLFRDRLREHPDDLALYAEAKRGAARETNAAGEHVMQFNARKQPVIRTIHDRGHPGGRAAPAVTHERCGNRHLARMCG